MNKIVPSSSEMFPFGLARKLAAKPFIIHYSAFIVLLLLPSSLLMGVTTSTWTNGFGDFDITRTTNWSAGTPTISVEGIFNGSNGSSPIMLDNTSTSPFFNTLGLQFTTTPFIYTFNIASNTFTNLPFTVGDGFSGGIDNSVLGGSAVVQFFNITNGGTMTFQAGSSLDIASTGKVIYTVDAPAGSVSSSITLSNADAGGAHLTIGQINGAAASLSLNGNSSANAAIISVFNTATITFSGSSTAANAHIVQQSASSMSFNDSSSPGNATIIPAASTITFNTTNTTSTATLQMTNLSDAILLQNITLKEMDTDATCTVHLNNNTLTVNNPSDIPGILGNISGTGGSFVKRGNGKMTLGGTNTYTGGTFVNDFRLSINKVASLPIASTTYSATVNANGILELASTFTGTTNANILLTDPTAAVEVFSTNGTNLAGFIQGQGKLKVTTGIATLLNANNNYTGGTVISNGMLTATSLTLPVAAAEPSVTISGTSTLTFDQAVTGTYAGNIVTNNTLSNIAVNNTPGLTLSGALTGSGSLSLSNAKAILTNSGNNYSGGTTVPSGSILQGDGLSLQGAIADDGQVIFNQTSTNTFTGSISSTTTNALITKIGSGRLSMSSSSAGFKGTVNIQEGALLVDNVLGGTVNVFPGAILGGTGTLSNNVNNSGTVAPGHSIGTLTIGGNYVQSALGTYEVEINGNGQGDRLNVGGTAFLAGTLVVVSLDGVIDPFKTYTMVHADGGVHGVFLNVISTNVLLVPQVIYTSNDVQLRAQHLFSAVAETHNQKEVALQLQSITNPTFEEAAILTAFTALASSPATVDSARLALSQMSGEQYTNVLLTSANASRQFIRRLYDPLRSVISANPCCCNYACDPYEGDSAMPLTLWMEAGGGRSFLSHDHNASGFKADSIEFSLGAQTTVDDWTFGVAGGYEYDRLDYNIGGSGTNNIGLLGFYSLFRPCGYYVLADLVIDLNHCKVKRPILIGDIRLTAHGSPKAVQETLYFEAGKDFACNGLLLQPFIGLEVDIYTCKRVSESGASPLNLVVKRKNHTNTFSRLGVHVSASDACWALNFDFAWQYRLTQLSTKLKEYFHDFGNEFTILGVNLPRNSLDATANVSFSLGAGWQVYAEASAERWSHACSYTLLGGLKYAW